MLFSQKLISSVENTTQAALAILLEEKSQAETITADLVQAKDDMRAHLEDKLRAANESLWAAEVKAEDIKAALESATTAAAEGAAHTVAEGAVDTIVASATATVVERDNTRRTVAATVAAANETIDAATKETERVVGDAETAARDAEAEVEQLREEVGHAKNAEQVAADERDVAREKVSELKGAMEEAEGVHVLFRERAASRLENLRLAVEEEDLEHGAQVATLAAYHGS